MKITILTFQFAHNYGALLQAYALQQYLLLVGHQVDIAPYYPQIFNLDYAINPLIKGISLRRRLKLAVTYSKRKKQAECFVAFQTTVLNTELSIQTEKKLCEFLNQYDMVICGSDQIWNDKLTGDTSAYFGAGTKAKLVSYAASLGVKQLTKVQEKNIQKYIPGFFAVSVREWESKELLQQIINCDVKVVLDPVFLLPKKEWEKRIAKSKIKIDEPYLILYFLQNDNVLLHYAKCYAQEKHLRLLEIHPTITSSHKGAKKIESVGPDEFLYLIKNAACVCTNSFHATAFSVIFRKKLLHIPNCNSPERTVSLLKQLEISLIDEVEEEPLYNLAMYNEKKLKVLVENSGMMNKTL